MQQVLSLHLRTEARCICTARAYVELSTSSAPPHTAPPDCWYSPADLPSACTAPTTVAPFYGLETLKALTLLPRLTSFRGKKKKALQGAGDYVGCRSWGKQGRFGAGAGSALTPAAEGTEAAPAITALILSRRLSWLSTRPRDGRPTMPPCAPQPALCCPARTPLQGWVKDGHARPTRSGPPEEPPPPRAIRRSPAGGRRRLRSACPARERPPSARLGLGRRQPPLRRPRRAAGSGREASGGGRLLQPGLPRTPRLLAAPPGLGGEGWPPQEGAAPPFTASLSHSAHRNAPQGGSPTRPRTSHAEEPAPDRSARLREGGQGCLTSPELMEAVLVGLKQLPQDEFGCVRLVPLEQLLEMGICGQRHAGGRAGIERTCNGDHGEWSNRCRPAFIAASPAPPRLLPLWDSLPAALGSEPGRGCTERCGVCERLPGQAAVAVTRRCAPLLICTSPEPPCGAPLSSAVRFYPGRPGFNLSARFRAAQPAWGLPGAVPCEGSAPGL